MPGTPDFTKTDGVAAKAGRVLLDNILNGFRSPGSPALMPPKGGDEDLTLRQIREVLSYLHHRFRYGIF